ncbi:MAG: tRNA (guanosine(37)-N1)-methyltransferase TrmD [Candidatus Omnitrophica bacterium]|nr:tRNA (guanosine(37)-N1)-methyltransferase TrmD [Candidatus Omnitrophota bacterium]
MNIDIITIFPGMFNAVLGESIIRRAVRKNIVKIRVYDLRDYTADKHRSVDDKPYGGGAGMVLMIEPIHKALMDILGKKCRAGRMGKIILMSPKGKRLDQSTARRLSKLDRIVLICGHYEGVDDRVRATLADEAISIGDYVLTCGELPAMVLVDCIVRLLPGVLGDDKSNVIESFEDGLLEYPQFTRPSVYNAAEVPGVLLSGNHKLIEEWRKKQAYAYTKKLRPDLIKEYKNIKKRKGGSR